MIHNTSEMIDCGTHVRTSPFARAIYDTTATSVVIDAWNNVYSVQPSAAELGVYVDGVYQESVYATANGASQHIVALPAGLKRVEIVTGGFRGPDPAGIPSVVGPAIWLRRLQFNKNATAVMPSKEKGVVIVGDSIANGSTLSSAIQQSYPRLLQMQNDFPVTVLGRGGLALHDVTVSLGTESEFRPKKMAREILKHNPQLVIYNLGYNDAVRNVWTQNTYSAAISSLATEIATLSPGTEFVAIPMLYASTTSGNYASINQAVYYTDASVRIAASHVITADDLAADGIHINAVGHAKLAASLAPWVASRSAPEGVTPFAYDLPSGTTSFYFNINGTSYRNGSAATFGPPWYQGTGSPSDYNYRATLEEGTAAPSGIGSVPFDQWGVISSRPRGFSVGAGDFFRVRVDIAAPGTTDIVGTFYVWRGDAFAPET